MNRNTRDSESVSTLENTIPPSISNQTIGTQEQVIIEPPFLVRTKTREEKNMMRQQFKNQEAIKDKRPYGWLQRFYTRFSTSFMLENKAATARDHLANERTFLAWLRTSLSLITVGVGKIALTKGQFPASRGAVIFGSTCILAVLIAMFIVILLDMK
ncbi:hypothetical protein HPULCUR_006696 [Helicostylum pulchrum]|uniref:DUF202 domain-containing protein n=1 Tax=Helicostylum pulchrum TaxID=562976 RepID=A0ABP9Y2T7_9FUNG